jgi:hypothetical protein
MFPVAVKRPGPTTGTAVVALALACGLAAAGCAGASVVVTASRSRYPLSLSPEVRDATGRLYDQRSLTKVGTLDVRQTSVGFLYSGFTPRSTRDFSDEINAQVAAAGGEAVVGLTITVRARCDWLNGFPLLDALPIWPGCVPVRLTGDIVRR